MQTVTAGLLPRDSCPPKYRGAVIVPAIVGMALALTAPLHAKHFGCAAGDVQCLIAAINEANANGHNNTIELQAGAYTLTAVDSDTSGPNGVPSITSTLTIKGAGANATSITRTSTAPRFRLVHVAASGNLTLAGVTLSGGFLTISNPQGGGLFNDGGTVNLDQTIVGGNSAPEGGGLYNNGGDVTITHSTFVGNGAIFGGGLFSTNGTLTVTESRFRQNGAMENGAIQLQDGTAFITKSTFDGNGAEGGAGGIGLCSISSDASSCAFDTETGGKLVVADSAFTNNGGVFPPAGAIGIFDSRAMATVSNTTFARNALAIWNAGTLRLNSATFADNTNDSSSQGVTLRSAPGATTILENTILARTINTALPPTGTLTHDCSGVITSLGNNLIGDPTGCNINLQLSDLVGDPGLDTFQDNGQPGNGHFPLLPSSRAIDAANDSVCPKKDQIGQPRPPHCDIGAIEFRRSTSRND